MILHMCFIIKSRGKYFEFMWFSCLLGKRGNPCLVLVGSFFNQSKLESVHYCESGIGMLVGPLDLHTQYGIDPTYVILAGISTDLAKLSIGKLGLHKQGGLLVLLVIIVSQVLGYGSVLLL